MNTKVKRWSCVIVAVLAVAGCEDGPKSGRGFRLPDGNPEQGKAAFVKLHCNACHQVVGVEMPAPETKGHLNVFIGGEVTRLRSYGELVTSVINPSHGLAEGFDRKKLEGSKLSPMPEFNDLMTVQQMIDIVAFLHPRYKKLDPAPYYPVY